MTEGQFNYTKNGRPVLRTKSGEPLELHRGITSEPLPPAQELRDPCPTCRNRLTQVIRNVKQVGSKPAHRQMGCADCGTTFEVPWDINTESRTPVAREFVKDSPAERFANEKYPFNVELDTPVIKLEAERKRREAAEHEEAVNRRLGRRDKGKARKSRKREVDDGE